MINTEEKVACCSTYINDDVWNNMSNDVRAKLDKFNECILEKIREIEDSLGKCNKDILEAKIK